MTDQDYHPRSHYASGGPFLPARALELGARGGRECPIAIGCRAGGRSIPPFWRVLRAEAQGALRADGALPGVGLPQEGTRGRI